MRSPRLAALELRRFGRGRLPRAALVALLLLPLLYGALYLWSFWDPYGRLDKIPVALVNEDTGARSGGQRLAAGEQIVRGLRDSDTFDWHEVSARSARRGVEDGTYYLSLTLPRDLSGRIASSGGDSPRAGALRVRTNDANNYIVGQISRTVFSEVRSAASTRATRGVLDQIFVSFSDLHDQTAKAAKGADRIKDGTDEAKKGAGDLSSGLGDAKTGSGDLVAGLGKLTKGSAALESGSARVAAGTKELAGKVDGVADTVRPYLKDNEGTIADTARLVADGAGTVRAHLGTLAENAPGAARAARTASRTLDGIYANRCAAGAAGGGTPAPAVPTPGASPPAASPSPGAPDASAVPCAELRKAKDAADRVAGLASGLDKVVGDHEGDLARLDSRLGTLQKQAKALAAHAPRLDEDLDTAVAKIDQLNSGAQQVAKGAAALHRGLGQADTGAGALDRGVGRLESGAGKLDGGLYRLADGTGTLADGLHSGVGKIPDYDEKERDRHTAAMADPVRLASQALHKAPNYGTGFAPYFIPLALWVGAMVAYMLIAPLNRRALATGASARRVALASWLPVVALGFAQVGALMAVLHWGLGLQLPRAAGTLGFLCLTTAAFAALVQWLNAQFGAAGRILVLALLMLQLTSAGGTYPVQTSPAFFNALHPFLPMSHVVDALRRLITGGGSGPVWEACAVLTAYTLAALALTVWCARRKQVWTVSRLHPELSL